MPSALRKTPRLALPRPDEPSFFSDPKRIRTITSIARRYRVTHSTVHRWCQKGLIVCEQTPGGLWNIAVDEHSRIIDAEPWEDE